MCMSGDGKLVAAGCEDGTLRIWDMSSNQVIVSFRYVQTYSTHTLSHFIPPPSFPPSPSLLSSLSLPPSPSPSLSSGHKSAVTCIQFDHSGTRLVSGSKVSVSLTLVSHDTSRYYCFLGHQCDSVGRGRGVWSISSAGPQGTSDRLPPAALWQHPHHQL